MIIHESTENKRVIEINTYVATLKKEGEYGFWEFQWSSGPVPEVLSGRYTAPSAAYADFQNWYNKLPPRLQPNTLTVKERKLQKAA